MKPPAVISIDIDSLWVIARLIGQSARLDEHAIFTRAVPEFLRLLDRASIKATFFCVGRDLTIAANREMVLEIARRGHEIGNHTMTHPTDWRTLTPDEIRGEIRGCHEVLEQAGIRPVTGFRASGYYLDRRLVHALGEFRYAYDTSVLPSYVVPLLMPLARSAMAGSSTQRSSYGQLGCVRAPLRPYFLDEDNVYRPAARPGVVELPIAAIPFVRVPFHMTFVWAAGLRIFQFGLRAFRRAGLPLTYVFHAVDLFDGDAEGRLRRMAAMRVPFTRRLEMVEFVLRRIAEEYRVMTCAELATEVRGRTSAALL